MASNKNNPPLSIEEQEHAQKMYEKWIEAFGDDSVLRELYRHGLIEGKRSIISVEKHTDIAED